MFAGLEQTKEVIDNNFDGMLYTYNYNSVDPFIHISKYFNLNLDFRYFVAIRSYAISPQYIFKILKSFYHLEETNSEIIFTKPFDHIGIKSVPICINLVSGSIDSKQQHFGGTIDEVNDSSSSIERSKHLIKFISEFNKVNDKHFNNFFHSNLYISTTNNYVFEEAIKKNNKMIIEYQDYASNKFKIDNPENVMVTFGPVIRYTQEELHSMDKNLGPNVKPNSIFCTPDQLKSMLDKLKSEGIQEVLFWSLRQQDHTNMLHFVKKYKGER